MYVVLVVVMIRMPVGRNRRLIAVRPSCDGIFVGGPLSFAVGLAHGLEIWAAEGRPPGADRNKLPTAGGFVFLHSPTWDLWFRREFRVSLISTVDTGHEDLIHSAQIDLTAPG